MRISAKARYAMATMVYFAMEYPNKRKFSVQEVAERLNISKIYMEQVFTQLKAAGIVNATKGPQGGYSLARDPSEITAYQVLSTTETSLFDAASATVADSVPSIESALMDEVYNAMDASVKKQLSGITLEQLAWRAHQNSNDGYMYYV